MRVRTRARWSIGAVALVASVVLGGCAGSPPVQAPVPTSSFVPTPSSVAVPPPVTTPTPPPPGPEGPRPANGQIILRTGGKGSGVLTVENGGRDDTYATLALGKKIVRGMYVQGGQTASVKDVPDGNYDLYFASGSGWNSSLRQFTSNRSASRYDDQFPFTTTRGQYTEWTASLTPVVGGNASTSEVSDADLPQ